MQRILDIPLRLDEQQHVELASKYPTALSFLTSRPLSSHSTEHDPGREAEAVLLDHVQRNIAPQVQSGRDLLAQFHKTRLLPTGCASIDDILLRGGVREEHHVEITGECGSGKTQLCMQMAAFTALRRERVAYIDTAGSFAWAGFQAMAGALPRHAECAGAAEAQRFLDLYRVFSLHDLLQLLRALSKALDQEAQQRPDRDGPHGPRRLSLLVVDSLSFLVSPVMGPGGTDDGHALMICLGRALKQLSQRHKLAVLTTNHIVGGYDDIKPALGESWKVQANLRIALSCMGPVLRRACLVANTLGPCGACAYYELGVGGPKAVNAPA